MKKILISVACVFALTGCTSSTQKIAAESAKRGMEQISNITHDLATEAKQSALNAGDQEVKHAVAAGDAAWAADALEIAFNKCDRINWLQIEMEKAKAYMRLSQMYIWSQQGVLDIMYRDFKKAKAAADAANPPQ